MCTVPYRDGDHLKDDDCLRSGDRPRDDKYSNYGWCCQLHPLKFKEYYLMFMSEIWDRQTDRQTLPCIELLRN